MAGFFAGLLRFSKSPARVQRYAWKGRFWPMFMSLGTLATLAYLFVLGSGSQVSFGLTWSFVTQLMPGKQQGRRFPFASMSQAASIRRSRVSACLAELTQRTHSRRAMGVISVHRARAFAAVLRAVVSPAAPGLPAHLRRASVPRRPFLRHWLPRQP